MKITDLGPTVAQAAESLDIPQHQIRRYIRDGLVEAMKFGHRWRITKEGFQKLTDAVNEFNARNEIDDDLSWAVELIHGEKWLGD